MATVNGTIDETGQSVTIVIPTVRIPELAPLGDPIEGADTVAVYDTSENATRQRSLDDIRTYMNLGSGADPVPPTLQGSQVEIIVDETNISGYDAITDTYNKVLVPALQNATFGLQRVGYGKLLARQYNIVSSGGFQLTDDTVRIGDVFFADTFSAAPSAPGGGSVVASIINGIAIISDDITLSSAHYNKLLHLSSNTKNIAVTLPDISDVPANAVICLETTISYGFFSKIQTQSGQLIYSAESGVTYLWLGSNEFLWLLRGNDGWYLMKASESIFNVGKPTFDYIERANTMIAKGQLISRSLVPRIVDLVASNPDMVISDTVWNADARNHAKFSSGNGSTTIRLPDLQGQFFRALKNVGGTDAERLTNKPGDMQADQVGPFTLSIPRGDAYTGDSQEAYQRVGGGQFSNIQTPVILSHTTTETRSSNAGFYGLINI